MKGQMTDSLSLDQMLDTMKRLGSASDDFIYGYADGFKGPLMPGSWSLGYERGVRAGESARARGAHQRDDDYRSVYGVSR